MHIDNIILDNTILAEIIEPIQSRCAILRFTKLSDAEILERLQDICEQEKVEYELPGLEVRSLLCSYFL